MLESQKIIKEICENEPFNKFSLAWIPTNAGELQAYRMDKDNIVFTILGLANTIGLFIENGMKQNSLYLLKNEWDSGNFYENFRILCLGLDLDIERFL